MLNDNLINLNNRPNAIYKRNNGETNRLKFDGIVIFCALNYRQICTLSGLEVIKPFSCSTKHDFYPPHKC